MLRELVIEPIGRQIESFYKVVFQNLSGFSLTMLGGFVGLWLLIVAYKAIAEGEFHLPQIVKKVLVFSALGGLLSFNNSGFHEYIYTPIKDTTNGLVGMVLSISPTVNGQRFNSVNDAVDKLEWTFNELATFVHKVADKGGLLLGLGSMIVVAIISFVFLLSETIYALYIIGNTMKLAAIGALSPLLIVAFAFSKTRGHAVAALQYLLSSALTLVIASFCVGLLLFVLRKFQANINLENINGQDVSNMLNALLVLAFIAAYFLLLAPGIASAIAGARGDTALTGIAATAITGGMTLMASKLGLATLINTASLSSRIVGKFFGQNRGGGTHSNQSAAKTNFSENYQPKQNRGSQ